MLSTAFPLPTALRPAKPERDPSRRPDADTGFGRSEGTATRKIAPGHPDGPESALRGPVDVNTFASPIGHRMAARIPGSVPALADRG